MKIACTIYRAPVGIYLGVPAPKQGKFTAFFAEPPIYNLSTTQG